MTRPTRQSLNEFQNPNQSGEQAAAAAEPAKAALPAKVKLLRKGNEVELDLEKALDFASKGFDYETRMREVKDARDALTQDKRAYDEFQEFRGRLQNDPTFARAVMKAVNDPQSVLNGNSDSSSSDSDGNEGDEGTGQTGGTGAHAAATLRELERLRSDLGSLKSERDQERFLSDLDRRINGEVDIYSYLKGKPEWADMVKRNVLLRMDSEKRGLDAVPDIFSEEAGKVKRMAERDLSDQLEQQHERSRLATRPPYAGGSTATGPAELGREDLRNSGKMMKHLLEAASQFGLPVPQKRGRR